MLEIPFSIAGAAGVSVDAHEGAGADVVAKLVGVGGTDVPTSSGSSDGL